MTMAQRGAKTSIDLLEERNALRDRVEHLERSLDAISAEIEHADQHPDIVYLTFCRVRALLQRARSSPQPRRVLDGGDRPGLARAAG